MFALSEAHRALAAVDLRPGLSVSEVQDHLQQGMRLRETGLRILAFYLTEMSDRRLHQETGHSSTVAFARDRLGLDPRRARELIVVGRTLLTLPEIDRAFCEQRIGWSKVIALARVATPEHEAAWLKRALASSCRALALEVRLSKPGRPPRKRGDRKGLPEVRFILSTSLGVLTHQKWDLAKQKLAAERGAPVDDAQTLDVLAELFLQTDQDGVASGRKRVSSSLYRIVLRVDADNTPDADRQHCALVADSEEGSIPLPGPESDDILARARTACIACDAEHVAEDDAADATPIDRPTPPALRRRVIDRDAGRCRCCDSRFQLMVHHIRFRSCGGPTRADNLITLCVSCHALVHADLLVLTDAKAGEVGFTDARGAPLDGSRARAVAILELATPRGGVRSPPQRAPFVGLDDVPATVDGAWWRRHAALIQCRGERGLVLQAGRALQSDQVLQAEDPRPEPPSSRPFEDAFAGMVGQADRLVRLERTACASQARRRPFPHTLFVGPPGTGKTTLARRVAARCGGRLLDTSGPLLQDTHSLVRLLAELDRGDLLLIDEVHAVPRAVLEALYQAMAERCLTLTLHSGARTRVVHLELPPFTLLAATTEEGDLPHALRSRFGLRESLTHYPECELADLVQHVSLAQGLHMQEDAAARLATDARGTPREALRLLDRVMDEAALAGRVQINSRMVEDALGRLGLDDRGIDATERQYLRLLRESTVPVPLGRLSRMLGASPRTLVEHIEPFLFRRGLVHMTSRGRVAAT